MKKYIVILLSILTLQSCSSVKQIGDINMVSSRNVDNNSQYVLLKSYMGGEKKEIKESKQLGITSLEQAINKVVKATAGGEFLRNVKIYLVDGQYIAVEGDVWGTAGVKENFRGFSQGDQVVYKNGKQKGTIVALKNDKTCLFQEFGETKVSEITYDNITKSSFSDKEVEEYIEKKKEPFIKFKSKS